MRVSSTVCVVLCVFSLAKCKQPNFILVVTDDQDVTLGTLKSLKKTQKLIADEGVTFINTFTSSPICCPSRSSLLTGLYQHNHHVFNNSLSGNCSSRAWQQTHENNTFSVALKNKGYTTFYAGKYLNQYGREDSGGAGHVPPGWDHWIALIGNSKYYNYTLSVNGKKKYFGRNYLTNVLKSYSLDFLQKMKNSSEPFLMVIAPPAPHHPFTPEPKYRGHFRGLKIPRTDQFNYPNNSDKHWLVQMMPSPLPLETVAALDLMYSSRWESLLSVDDLVASLIESLHSIKKIDDTYVFFLSDNGFHLGQLSLTWDKRQLYEFDIRVPLLVRGPNLHPHSSRTPVLIHDIAPTLLHLAGLDSNAMDGTPFLPIRKKSKRFFLIEYHGEGGNRSNVECGYEDENLHGCTKLANCKCQDMRNNTYVCLRGLSSKKNFIYCQFKDFEGTREAYDLNEDPYQLKNRINNINKKCRLKLDAILHELITCARESCLKNQSLKCPRFNY